MKDLTREPWMLKNWPILTFAFAVVAWGVRLEERMNHHVKQPYHEGMRQSHDDLLEIKVEIRHIREDVQRLNAALSENTP